MGGDPRVLWNTLESILKSILENALLQILSRACGSPPTSVRLRPLPGERWRIRRLGPQPLQVPRCDLLRQLSGGEEGVESRAEAEAKDGAEDGEEDGVGGD